MRKIVDKVSIHLLPTKIWEIERQNFRSNEMTPIYIDRYNGIRTNPSPGTHDFWEMTYVFKGRGVLKAEKEFLLSQYTVCLIPPKTPHSEICKEKMDTLWVGLEGSRLNFLDHKKIYVLNSLEFNPLFEKLWIKAEKPYGSIGPELDGLVQWILGSFIRAVVDQKDENHDYIDLATQYMQKNFSEKFSISFLAGKFGYSEGYFYRAFKKRTSQTPAEFLTLLRMQHARRMLQHTSLTIDKIAKLVGFSDPLYFSKVFHKYTGKSPSQYKTAITT